MPGWHEATEQLRKQGRVQMLGIVEEQHPDRARLFMQWKQMGWPILVDSLNLLEVSAVPLTLAIDEHGVVRSSPLPLSAAKGIEQAFVQQTYEKPASAETPPDEASDLNQLRAAARGGRAEAWRAYANALVLWGGPKRLSQAIEAYQKALRLEPGHGPTHFRLGVAYRRRYDSPQRQPNDFQKAVEQWAEALRIDPNQYIWRRRIQQYGPRLAKPYPFYDWVPAARREIQARGEAPVPLAAEPGGSEYVGPSKEFTAVEAVTEEPDPRGRIARDHGEFIRTETVVVPPAIAAGASGRVHVIFRPNLRRKAHWNNEVAALALWIVPPQGWTSERRYLTVPNPPQEVSQETRTMEFEVKSPENAGAGSVTIPVYALYYVCEGVKGVCMYRRQDIPLAVQIGQR